MRLGAIWHVESRRSGRGAVEHVRLGRGTVWLGQAVWVRSVEISYVVVRFVAVSRGGLGVLGRDALCFGTLRQGQAV